MKSFDENLNDKHIYEVYSDKASRLLTFSIVILAFSLVSYLVALLVWDNFDFGFIFELFSFVCIIIAKNALIDKKILISKRAIIASMCSVGWLLIYDFINFLANINEIMQEVQHYYLSADYEYYYLAPYLVDILLIGLLLLLFNSFSSLSYADGTKKHNDYLDSFYNK